MTTAGAVPRIACVQHGDYGGARRRLAAGGDETYGGQRYSVDAFERLVADAPHLVISLDAPALVRERRGSSEYVGVPLPEGRWLPYRWKAHWRATNILSMLEQFAPTCLLLRTGHIEGCRVLEWANRRRIPTAVVLAARFDPGHAPSLEFCRRANDDNVLFVGNHNRVATASLVACGLQSEKAVAWDYPPHVTPDESPAKLQPNDKVMTVMYAGSVIEAKGVLEAVEAVERSRRASFPIRLVVCGEGPLRATLQAHPGVREGWLEVPGSLPSDQILERMKNSWVVVVPTRPSYPEALPLVITEALTTRTPVVLSDHPVFREYFVDGKGVRLFPAGDASALASVLSVLAADPTAYRTLSEWTADVWRSLQIETRFHHLLERFAREAIYVS